jgi:hypothetical protein
VIEDEYIGAFPDGDSRTIGGTNPFPGEVGAFGVLRDWDVAPHSNGANAAALDYDD